jgi:hypothetical protein
VLRASFRVQGLTYNWQAVHVCVCVCVCVCAAAAVGVYDVQEGAHMILRL